MNKILIKNGKVLLLKNEDIVIENKDILIENGIEVNPGVCLNMTYRDKSSLVYEL